MLMTKMVDIVGQAALRECDACRKVNAALEMHGYSERSSNICLCAECALQLSRKLLEDLCELLTKSGRRG